MARLWTTMTLPLCAGLIAVSLSACGSSASGGSASSAHGSGGASSSGGASAELAAAEAAVTKATGDSTYPAGTPVTPPKSMRIGIATCGSASIDCQTMAAEASKAIKALGWTPIVTDGQLSPTGKNAAVSQLVNDHVNGILGFIIGDSEVPQPLDAAAAAQIPVVCAVCANSLASSQVIHPSTANVDFDYKSVGSNLANFVILKTNGTAKVLQQHITVSLAAEGVAHAFDAQLTSCGGCSVAQSTTLQLSSDLVGAARTAAQASLSRYGNGQSNYIFPPSDIFLPGVVSAIQGLHRDDVHTAAFNCGDQTLSVIRTGSIVQACDAIPEPWAAWAAVDTMVRILAHQKYATTTILPNRLITKDNVPAAGEPAVKFDFVSYYEKLWGVSS
jgi:ribose transport system substrate-binding protein